MMTWGINLSSSHKEVKRLRERDIVARDFDASPNYFSIHDHLIYKKPSSLSSARVPGRKFYDRVGDQFEVMDSGRFKTKIIEFQISWLPLQNFSWL